VPSTPEVTVCIPTRNRWTWLSAHALPSALPQEDVDHEVIVVDDGSSDETPTRLAELSEPRLRVLRHEKRRGVAKARNTGIAAARGEWVAFLDDDDVWSPRKLRAQLDAASAQDADFIYAAIVKLDERGAVTELPPPPEPADLASALLARNVLRGGCSNVMAKTTLLRRVDGFDERLFQLCDWDLWVRLATTGRAGVCRDVVVGCVDHRASMLLTTEEDIFDEFDYLVEKHRELSRARGVEFDRAFFTRWIALGSVRAGRRLHAARLYLRAARDEGDPKSVVRALAALLGEPALVLARRLVGSASRGQRARADRPAIPGWLVLYR
jgi:glycosyltransferase involved in cell wall biosynthesis